MGSLLSAMGFSFLQSDPGEANPGATMIVRDWLVSIDARNLRECGALKLQVRPDQLPEKH